MQDTLIDSHGRQARYIRLSVTDRCNLRCVYCLSEKANFIPHTHILRYEELLEIARAAVHLGVEKIRITGGEPFARKNILYFLEELRRHFPQVDIRITTNGTLVRPHVAALHDLGITTINLSLDSFDRTLFASITGQDLLPEVLAAVDAILAQGLRLKINAVGMRGVNDTQMPHFIDFIRTHPVDVRFIEFMPMGSGTRWGQENYWPAEDILAKARQYATLIPMTSEAIQEQHEGQHSGPARMYTVEGGLGRFGLITPLSNHFCGSCNRLRVTSDGFLRTCLFADAEYRLRGVLRHPRLGLGAVQKVMALANARKPLGEEILRARQHNAVARKHMIHIGG